MMRNYENKENSQVEKKNQMGYSNRNTFDCCNDSGC